MVLGIHSCPTTFPIRPVKYRRRMPPNSSLHEPPRMNPGQRCVREHTPSHSSFLLTMPLPAKVCLAYLCVCLCCLSALGRSSIILFWRPVPSSSTASDPFSFFFFFLLLFLSCFSVSPAAPSPRVLLLRGTKRISPFPPIFQAPALLSPAHFSHTFPIGLGDGHSFNLNVQFLTSIFISIILNSKY